MPRTVTHFISDAVLPVTLDWVVLFASFLALFTAAYGALVSQEMIEAAQSAIAPARPA